MTTDNQSCPNCGAARAKQSGYVYGPYYECGNSVDGEYEQPDECASRQACKEIAERWNAGQVQNGGGM